jgi:hypothetical protein
VVANRVVGLEAAFDVGHGSSLHSHRRLGVQGQVSCVANSLVLTGLQDGRLDRLATVSPPTRAPGARDLVERLGNVVS